MKQKTSARDFWNVFAVMAGFAVVLFICGLGLVETMKDVEYTKWEGDAVTWIKVDQNGKQTVYHKPAPR